MLELPDVTLVLIETREHELAQLALEDCERMVDFGEVLVFTDRVSQFMRGDRRVVSVPDWPDKIGWSRMHWQGVVPHVRTSHALSIQWDSWVVAPEVWTDDWLQYDYIGAPWWYKDGLNVGNGGFCLRSTRLMRYLRNHRDRFACVTALDDDLLCRKYRPELQEMGFVWAPEDVALAFAFETTRPNKTQRHFGFHAAYNFSYGCSDDRDKLLERARIMFRSAYMTRSNPYLWEGFKKGNREIAEEVEGEAQKDAVATSCWPAE